MTTPSELTAADIAARGDLASRWARLGAFLIDVVLFYLPFAAAQPASERSAVGGLAVVAWLIIVVVQIVMLTRSGQTIAKRLLGIRIVKKDTGLNGGFVTNVLLRGVVNGLLSIIPLYGLVDALFIFREDKRCLHDLIASTIVVRGNP
jgi:uncharacterized RDD family membrane protein YckC